MIKEFNKMLNTLINNNHGSDTDYAHWINDIIGIENNIMKEWKCLFFCAETTKTEYIKKLKQMKHIIGFFYTHELKNSIYIKNINNILEIALYHIDEYPFVLFYKSDTEYFSLSLNDTNKVLETIKLIENNKELPSFKPKEDSLFLYHLSDCHLGNKKNIKGKSRLINVLDKEIPKITSNFPIKMIITGDIMDSPNKKNMYLATEFLSLLKRRYHVDISFILGNHDIMVHGINFLRRQKSKIIAYLLKDHIKVLEKEKIILIQLNSGIAGNFARGQIGERQLQEVEEELNQIPNINEYTKIAMLHHHILPVPMPSNFAQKNIKSLSVVGFFVDKSKILVDSKEVLSWLHKHNVIATFHGHKHIPAIQSDQDMLIIGAGSSMGIIRNKSGSYISYNLVKYDIRKGKIIVCFLCYEEIDGNGRHVYMKFF